MSAGDRGAELVVEAAVRALPVGVRERYREQWRADLRDAAAAGVSRAAVAFGAARFALTVPRGAAAGGYTPHELVARRLRWATTAFAAAAVLGAGAFLGAGFTTRHGEVVGWISRTSFLLAAACVIVGMLAAGSVMLAALHDRSRVARWSAAVGVSAGAPLAIAVSGLFSMQLVMLGGIVAGWVTAILAGMLPISTAPGSRATTPGIPARLGVRATALLAALAVVGAVVFAVVHVLVWNPLAKVPGATLGEIYDTMTARGESPDAAAVSVLVWSAGWVVLGVLFLLVAVFGDRKLLAGLDARRVARAALVAIAGIGFGTWFAGFSMGMSIADAFATSGGDAAVSGLVLVVAGVLAGLAAVIRILPPGRPTPTLRKGVPPEPVA